MDDPQLSLPKAPIISYFGNVTTPTRVRIIAARGILWLAILCLLLFTSIFIWNGLHLHEAVRWFAKSRSRAPVLQDYIQECWRTKQFFRIYFLDALLLLIPGVLLVILPRPIRLGRKIPSLMAMAVVIVLLALLALATLYYFCKTYVDIFNAVPHNDYSYAPWFLTTPVGVLGIGLLLDLCAFLSWIARQPTIEKPPQPFLPAKDVPG